MQARALVKERAQRNLLLVIDGAKTEELLLTGLAGISVADFEILHSMGLIVPMPSSRAANAAPGRNTSPSAPVIPAAEEAPAGPLDYAQFTAALTQMISKELGLRGFVLTLAVEKASTIEDLQDVAKRTLAQITERKGEAVAAASRRSLYGS